MKLEAQVCSQCSAPLRRSEACDYCGTIFAHSDKPAVKETKKPHPWLPYMTNWMGKGHYSDALHYGPEYPDTPTLVCAYRGDGPEITIHEEGNAPEATVDRLTELGRILP